MEINDELRELILVGGVGPGTQEESNRSGNAHASQERLTKAAMGQTTLEEVLRENRSVRL